MNYKEIVCPEWDELTVQSADERQLVAVAKLWIAANASSPALGKVLIKLVETTTSTTTSASTTGNAEQEIFSKSAEWLDKNYADESAPVLIGLVLESAQSRDFVCFAQRCLQSPLKLRQLRPLIQVVQDGPVYQELFDEVEKLLLKNSFDREWDFALLYRQNNKNTEELVCKWIELNQKNPRMSLLRHSSDARSPAVIDACFEWFRGGGDDPFSVYFLLQSARKSHRAILPELVNFARDWLGQNQQSKYAGYIYAELMASGTKEDVAKAKEWYESHQSCKSAWMVIWALLSKAYWNQTEPDEFAVANAKRCLADEKFRTPALISALVRVHVDDETLALAKEYLKADSVSFLVGLLRKSPDEETIAKAEKEFERTRDPQLLFALLRLNQKSEFAQKQARVWVSVSDD